MLFRSKNVAKYFTDAVNILHWNPGVFYNGDEITEIRWIGNSGIVFRKSSWEAIGGHPLENAGYDMTFIEQLHKYGGRLFADPPKNEASWFYMWAGRGYHMSGEGDDKPGKPNVIKRHSSHVETLRRKGLIPTGDVNLYPHWDKDYTKMLESFVATHQK